MTTEETDVLKLLGQAFTAFAALPPEHPSDMEEFAHAIYAAQNIVLARFALRISKA